MRLKPYRLSYPIGFLVGCVLGFFWTRTLPSWFFLSYILPLTLLILFKIGEKIDQKEMKKDRIGSILEMVRDVGNSERE